MHVSIDSDEKSKCPTAPAYTPRRSSSSAEMSSIARIFGAPETVPAGKMERNASNLCGYRLKDQLQWTYTTQAAETTADSERTSSAPPSATR